MFITFFNLKRFLYEKVCPLRNANIAYTCTWKLCFQLSQAVLSSYLNLQQQCSQCNLAFIWEQVAILEFELNVLTKTKLLFLGCHLSLQIANSNCQLGLIKHAFLLMGIWNCHWGHQDSKKIKPLNLLGWNTDGSGVVPPIPVTGISLKRLILAVPQTFPTSLPVVVWIINPVLITSKLSAENKSKGLSEAFVLISSASNSLPTSKLPITSSSPRAAEENKLTNRSSMQASFHHVEARGNLLEMFIRKTTRI